MHVLGTIITVADRTICSLRRMVILRMVILRTVILRTVTATVRMDILTTITIMDRVRVVIRTIGNQSIESKPTRPSTYRARPLFSYSIASVENTGC